MENKTTFNLTDYCFVTTYIKWQDAPSTVIFPEQTRRDNIIEVIAGNEELEDCDALITKNKALSLGIKTADCAIICLTDGEKIGIAHVGWRGLCLSLIEKILKEFKRENLKVFVGPFMHSFEIKKDFCFDQIQEKFGNKYFIENGEKITFLFKDAIMSLLPPDTKFDERNTFSDLSLPSFRRDKTRERLATVIGFK
ncbi:MAG: polyphenol oxidase family protein [Patescibacteria group bacterium]